MARKKKVVKQAKPSAQQIAGQILRERALKRKHFPMTLLKGAKR